MYIRPHRRQHMALDTLARRVIYNTMTMAMQPRQQTTTQHSYLTIQYSVNKHDINDRPEYST